MASGTNVNRNAVEPMDIPRTRRNHLVQKLTSFAPGVMAPIAAIPMMREDSFIGRFSLSCEMLETYEFIANRVNLRIMAYLVPWLAFDRFQGSRDQFDRSYSGQPQIDGGSVIPFFQTAARGADGANPILDTLGLHAPAAKLVNNMYQEAYNLIWNFRADNRSKELTKRLMSTTSLAPAFWSHSRFEHILPDFDQAVIDGEVALNIVAGGQLPVKGPAAATKTPVALKSGQNLVMQTTTGGDQTISMGTGAAGGNNTLNRSGSATGNVTVVKNLEADLVGVYAEMTAGTASISLSNLELAKKTQALAKIREKYEGIDDEYVIDMLMNGLMIPDQALKNPILLADKSIPFAQAKRYATDSANLAASAVSGGATMDLSVRVPRLNTGGIVMIVAEAVPEQLFERQSDPFLYADGVEDLPEFLRDYLDPEKVDVVLNGDIDTMHSTPGNTFGYAPMNWRWNAWGPTVGGKFYKPTSGTANDAERRRIWGVEETDPVLSTSFYIVKLPMHQKPFLNTTAHPFELSISGNVVLEGNTQFGGMLAEDTGNYDAILAEAPQDRIVQP